MARLRAPCKLGVSRKRFPEPRFRGGGGPTRQAGASHAPPPVGFPDLETRVHGFALKREDTEDALVDPAKRLLPNEPLQGFDAESKFTQRQ